jgi:hypothetical protein
VAASGTITCGSQDSLCGLVVNDPSNASQWSMQNNLQDNNQALGTDEANFTDIPSIVAGSPWIRPSGRSSMATADPLVTFGINAPAEVYVAIDARMALPAWMSGWADATATLAYTNTTTSAGTTSVMLKLYHAAFPAGNVTLGPLGCAPTDTACTMYIPIVKFGDQPSGGLGLSCLKEPTACNPPITSSGGLPCHGSVCTIGGYSGPADIAADTYGSSVCLAADSLCANGRTSAVNPGWGASFGVFLTNQAARAAIQLSSAGLSLEVTSIPTQGLRVQVSIGTVWYCATVTSVTQTIPWTRFNTRCWDNLGASLTGPPSASSVGFTIPAKASPASFDFCVKSLTF